MTKYTKKDLEDQYSERYRHIPKVQEQGAAIKRRAESIERLTKHLEKNETGAEVVFTVSSYNKHKTKIKYVKAIRSATGLGLIEAIACSEKPLPHLYVMNPIQADTFRKELENINPDEEFEWKSARLTT